MIYSTDVKFSTWSARRETSTFSSVSKPDGTRFCINSGISMLEGTPLPLFSQPSTAFSVSCRISVSACLSKSDASVFSVLVSLPGVLHRFFVIRGITSSFFGAFLMDLKEKHAENECRMNILWREKQHTHWFCCARQFWRNQSLHEFPESYPIVSTELISRYHVSFLN